MTSSPRKTQRSVVKESMSPLQLSSEESFLGMQTSQNTISGQQNDAPRMIISKELRSSSASLPTRSISCNQVERIRKSASTHLKSLSQSVVCSDRKFDVSGDDYIEKSEGTDAYYFSDDDQKAVLTPNQNEQQTFCLNKSNSDTNLAEAEDFHKQSSHNLIQSRKTVWSLSSLTIKNEESPGTPEKGNGDYTAKLPSASGSLTTVGAKKVTKSKLPRRVQSLCSKSSSK